MSTNLSTRKLKHKVTTTTTTTTTTTARLGEQDQQEKAIMDELLYNFTTKTQTDLRFYQITETYKEVILNNTNCEWLNYIKTHNLYEIINDFYDLPWNDLRKFSMEYVNKFDWLGVVRERMFSDRYYVLIKILENPLQNELSEKMKAGPLCKLSENLAALNLVFDFKYNVCNYQGFVKAGERMNSYLKFFQHLNIRLDDEIIRKTAKQAGGELLVSEESVSLIKTRLAFEKYKHSYTILQLWMLQLIEITCGASLILDDSSLQELKDRLYMFPADDYDFPKDTYQSDQKNMEKLDLLEKKETKTRRGSCLSSGGGTSNGSSVTSRDSIELLLVRPLGTDMWGYKMAIDEPNVNLTDYGLIFNTSGIKTTSPDFCESFEERLNQDSMANIDYDDYIVNVSGVPRNKSFEILQQEINQMMVKYEINLKRLDAKKHQMITNPSLLDKQDVLETEILNLENKINQLALNINSCVLAQNYGNTFNKYRKIVLPPKIINFLYDQEIKEKILKQSKISQKEKQHSSLRTGPELERDHTRDNQKHNNSEQTNVVENVTKSDVTTKLPFLNNSFHYVSAPSLWISITYNKWEPLAREMYRVLKPNGIFYTVAVDFSPLNLSSSANSQFETSKEKKTLFEYMIFQMTKTGHQVAPTRYLTPVLSKVGFKNIKYSVLTLKLGDFQSEMGKNNEFLFLMIYLVFFSNMSNTKEHPNADSFLQRYIEEHENKIDNYAGSLRISFIKATK